jgi:hypothetical protein
MAVLEPELKYYQKDQVDHAVDHVASLESEPSFPDLHKVVAASQVQVGIDKYLADAKAKPMTTQELRKEEHNSARLGLHLESVGKTRPSKCHAHAIVAGKHHNAAVIRALMARLKIRIDDPDNGCWLPENTAATPHPNFPAAVPHSRIHRYNYYFWLRHRLGKIRKEDMFRVDLQLISQHLQQSTMPDYVMLKKGQGLPNGGRI